MSIADARVTEGNTGTTNAFTVALSKADSTVTVGYATANGTATAGQDYTATTGTLTFAPGETTKTITVAVTGDTAVEPNETFTVTLSNPTGATLVTAPGHRHHPQRGRRHPAGPGDRWGTTFYAPYVDMGGWPVPDLLAISQTNGGGSRSYTAAFMQATPDGKLAWQGSLRWNPAPPTIRRRPSTGRSRRCRSAGGDVMVSLGGQAGTSLAQWGSTHGMTAAR